MHRHAALSLVAGLTLALPLAAQRPESFALAGRAVAIYNLAGSVRVERGSGDKVTIEVARHGADASHLTVETGTIGDRATLRVRTDGDRIVYPEMRRGSETTVDVRRDGRWGGSEDGEVRGFRDRMSWGSRVRISASGSGVAAWADLVVRVPDGVTVSIHHAVGALSSAGVHAPLSLHLASATVDVRDQVGDLEVDAGSGRTSVTNIEGRVSLDLGSGRTELYGIKASDLKIDAGSGSVTGDDVSVSGRLELDAGSGHTDLRRLSVRRAKLDLGSGGLTAEFLTSVDDLTIDSGSGAVTLYLPESLGAQIDIDSGSGGVSTDFPVTTSRADRQHLVGTIGDGKGRISVDAGSGSVRLRKVGAK